MVVTIKLLLKARIYYAVPNVIHGSILESYLLKSHI